MDANQLIEAIENAGFEARSYSGRGMYGKSCVGAMLGSEGELWSLAVELARAVEDEIPRPRTDSLGRGIVAYWPRYEWPAEAA